MFRSFCKVMPALTLLGVGYAQAESVENTNMQRGQKTKSYQPAANCGINETDCTCFARSCSCAMGGAVEADFLYWRAETASVALETVSGSSEEGNEIQRSVHLKPKWDPGFRFGVGWNSDYDRWDVFVDWTWYQNHSKKSFHTKGHFNGGDFGGDEGGAADFQEMTASWKLRHNMFDLELGRAFYLTKAFSVRPLWGVRGGWLNQKFHTDFAIPTDATSPTTAYHDAKNNYWGIGPRLGIHGKFHIDDSWSVLGKASTALLLGKTKERQINHSVDAEAVVHHRVLTDDFTQLIPNLQIFLGFDWGSCFACGKYYFGVNAGWETTMYWNLPVTMEGLTVNVHFDF